MANSQLITGAKDSASNFVDVGGAVMEGVLTPENPSVARNQARIMQQRMANQVELQNYVTNMDTIEINKVEESMKPEVNDFLIKSRNEYAAAAKIASKTDAEDPAYREAVETMNRVNTSFKSLSTNLDQFKVRREQFYTDFEDGNISDSNSLGTTDRLTALYKDEDYDIVVDPYGGFTIQAEDGEYIPISAFNEDTDYNYSLKNYTGFNELNTLVKQANDGQVVIGDDTNLKRNYTYKINSMLNGMNREDLLSLVYDDPMDATVALVDRDDFEDDLLLIENQNALKDWVAQEYIEDLQSVAKESAQLKYNKDNKPTKAELKDRATEKKLLADVNKFVKPGAVMAEDGQSQYNGPKDGDFIMGARGRSVTYNGGVFAPYIDGRLQTGYAIYTAEDIFRYLNNKK